MLGIFISKVRYTISYMMSSPVGAWSLISHHDLCVFGSISYLIFSDKILSRSLSVCLVFIIVFLVLFFSYR